MRVTAHGDLARSDGRALYFVDGRDAVQARADGVRRVSLRGRGCVADEALSGVELVPLGDGRRALAVGTAGNMPFDLWGHAGRHRAARCLVDFAQHTATDLAEMLPGLLGAGLTVRAEQWFADASGKVYRAEGSGPWRVVSGGDAPPLTGRDVDARRCALGDDGDALVVACVVDGAPSALRLTRWTRAGQALASQGDRAVTIAGVDAVIELAMAPDARAVALRATQGRDRVLLLVDVGAAAVRGRARVTGMVSVAALGGGRGALAGVEGGRGAVHRVTPDGRVARTWSTDDVPWHLHATLRDDQAWAVGSDHAALLTLR